MSGLLRTLQWRSKRLIQGSLLQLGYRLVRLTEEERLSLTGVPVGASSIAGADETLRPGNPRLNELRARYQQSVLPMAERSLWSSKFLTRELSLAAFRADNPYVWQYRHMPENLRRKYYLFARYVAERDPRGLLTQLQEDGAFGCHTFAFEGLPVVSRDLLDSINEIYFLDRTCGLFGGTAQTILDIGAGYGRLAHRMAAALPGLERYYCVDAIPESTFLSEFYLRYRGCDATTRVIPLDQLDQLQTIRPRLAVNIHSFSEMSYDAIAGWLRLIADLGVPRLLIVPNDNDRLFSYERDRRRRDFAPLIRSFGYRLALQEPTLRSADFRRWVGVEDYFLLFERAVP